MNTDIRIDVGFLDHWKTDSLINECGADGVLALMRLWVFAAQNKPDGRLTGIKDEMIERIAKWRGDSGKLTGILIETRFIEKNEEGVWCLHDWERHNPYAANAEWRHERAKKANAARRAKESGDSCNISATSQLQASYKPAPSPSPAPAPSPSPEPETDMVVVVGDCRASAREEPPPPPPPKVSAASPTEAETGFRVITETWNAICGPLGIERLSDPGDWSQERRDRAWWLWAKAAKCNPEKIREVCEYVVSCPRLIGKAPPGKGYAAPWVVDFDWLMRPENFQKFREGHFSPRGEARA